VTGPGGDGAGAAAEIRPTGGAETQLLGVIMALRRPFTEEPMSKLALWSGRLAVFALVVTVMSVIIVRTGILDVTPALATFAAALIFAALAVLLGFASFVTIWRQGLSGLGRSILGMLLGVLLLAYPAYLANVARKLPAINDVTTDTANPPRFDVLSRLRPRGTDAYPARFAALQRAAYPSLQPLLYDAPPKAIFDIAFAVVSKRKWHVVDARPPTATRREGDIEAVARTLIMGFRDDVVVRVTAVEDGTRLDVRSASRVGYHDFGANAARVRALLDDIDDAVGSAPDQGAEQPEKKAPAPKRPAEKKPEKK
jgi:uncharacterized protein (DUF1499 family)